MRRRRATVKFAALLAGSATLRALAADYDGRGYELTRLRVYRRSDGSFTARVVWRNREALLSAVACTVRGIAAS